MWPEIRKRHRAGPLQKAVNFVGAMFRHIAAGSPKVTEEQHKVRVDVCHGCPQFKAGYCLLCGCGIEAKAWFAEQKCPLDKWPT
jgi:hypothetical protein